MKFARLYTRLYLILSTIFNAIGCRVEVEKMIATGRIDMVVETTNFIYVLELKLSNNGGIDAATEQIRTKQYTGGLEGSVKATPATSSRHTHRSDKDLSSTELAKVQSSIYR